MNAYDNVNDLEAYLDKQNLVSQFISYVTNTYNVAENYRELNISKDIILNQIKAYIARNIIDNKGFYPIWNKNDATFIYAVDFLKNSSRN